MNFENEECVGINIPELKRLRKEWADDEIFREWFKSMMTSMTEITLNKVFEED